jgi:hypothetical protein
MLRWVGRKDDAISRWARDLKQRRHPNVAIVAMAKKLARIASLKTWKGPTPACAETESLIKDGEVRGFHQGTGTATAPNNDAG